MFEYCILLAVPIFGFLFDNLKIGIQHTYSTYAVQKAILIYTVQVLLK